MNTDTRANARQRALLRWLSEDATRPDFVAKPWGYLQRGRGRWVVTIYPPLAPKWAVRVARLRMHRVALSRGSAATFDLPTVAVLAAACVTLIVTWRLLPIGGLAGALLAGWGLLARKADRELAQCRVAELSPDRVVAWAQTFRAAGWPLHVEVAIGGHVAQLIDLALRFEHASAPVDLEATRWRLYDLVPLPAHLPTRDGEMRRLVRWP